jgi:hypothetical protein
MINSNKSGAVLNFNLKYLQDQIPSSINQICKVYGVTKNSLYKLLDLSEEHLDNHTNLTPQLLRLLQNILDDPKLFNDLIKKNGHKLTPMSVEKTKVNLHRALLEVRKEKTGLAFLKVLGAHELGYRKGVPGKAGSFLFVPKEAAKKFFGELHPLKINDNKEFTINAPNEYMPVNFSYVYHNSKYATDDPDENRDEYRLYSTYLKDLTPDNIALITYSGDEADFRMYLFSPNDTEYKVLEELIDEKRIGRSSSALVSLVDLFSNKVIITEMFNPSYEIIVADPPYYTVPKHEPNFPNLAITGIGDLLTEEIIIDDVEKTIQQINKIKRDYRFRAAVINAYKQAGEPPRCAVTGTSITFGDITNLQAAHIIPKELGGSDNPTNGIPLTGDIHWAFDRGFFTILDDYTVKVHPEVTQNELLKNIDRRKIFLPDHPQFYPSKDALEYHREYIYGKFIKN